MKHKEYECNEAKKYECNEANIHTSAMKQKNTSATKQKKYECNEAKPKRFWDNIFCQMVKNLKHWCNKANMIEM